MRPGRLRERRRGTVGHGVWPPGARARAGRRGVGARVPRRAPLDGRPLRGEGAAPAPGAHARGAPALLRRGALAAAAPRPPERGAGARRASGPERPPLHAHGVRGGHRPVAPAAAAAARGGGVPDAAGARGPGGRSRPRPHPPGLEAGEPRAHPGAQGHAAGEDPRLRHGEHARGGPHGAGTGRGHGGGQPGLPRARAVGARRAGWPRRPVLARGAGLPALDGTAALWRGRTHGRGAARGRAHPSARAAPVGGERASRALHGADAGPVDAPGRSLLQRSRLRGGVARGAAAARVRVADALGRGLMPVFVNDLSEEGLRIAWDGALPRLGARLDVELSLNGWVLACSGDVVRLLPTEEARTWGGRQGFILHFSEPSEDVRRLIAQALAPAPVEAAPDAELAQLLARATACRQDPYSLLAIHPNSDFAEVSRRVTLAERRLEPFRQRLLPDDQRRGLEALRNKLEMARRTLGEPVARARFDASRGNFRGVAHCLSAGISPTSVNRLRQAFLAARPQAEGRARVLFDKGVFLEARDVLDGALERYTEALRMDPLNVSLHRYYHSLARRIRESRSETPRGEFEAAVSL